MSAPEPVEQSTCCRHDTAYLCTCPQGFRSHAMPDDGSADNECDCGKIKMAAEAWRSCSGQTHVFHENAPKCDCGRRFAGVETV